MENEGEDDISILLRIRKVKNARTGIIVINSHVMQLLEEMGVGVGDAVELIFGERKEIGIKLRKKRELE